MGYYLLEFYFGDAARSLPGLQKQKMCPAGLYSTNWRFCRESMQIKFRFIFWHRGRVSCFFNRVEFLKPAHSERDEIQPPHGERGGKEPTGGFCANVCNPNRRPSR